MGEIERATPIGARRSAVAGRGAAGRPERGDGTLHPTVRRKEAALARTTRRPLVPLATAGLVVLLSGGCALVDPEREDSNFAQPADGNEVEITQALRAENLLVVTPEEGEPGRLSGALVNDTDEDVVFTLTVGDEQLEIDVPGEGTVLLGIDDPARVDAVPAAPGATAEIMLSAGVGGTVTTRVPVLDETLPQYEDYAP